jgi:hypothetical protein
MKALSMLPPADARGLVGLLFDLDDTVLSHGVLTREAYEAIWSLHEAGLRLVAVTGRPSGWGEVIARQWPIDGAVTENGAVHVVRDGKGVALLYDGDAAAVAERRARLDELVRTVAKAMPHVKLAELGCRATKPGGLVVVCSCSAAVDLFALTRALATGAVRANVHATIVERAFQGVDHPVPAAFSEGLYLKAIVARVDKR